MVADTDTDATSELRIEAATGAVQLLECLERGDLARSAHALDLAQAVFIALRAAHLLALHALEGIRDELPATVQALLGAPEAPLEPARDAVADPAEVVGFDGLLDFLSSEDLPCIAPQLHRGWQDRRQSCRHARRLCAGASGVVLGVTEREELLVALAIVKRVFLLPPPLRLPTTQVRQALSVVLRLVRRLAAQQGIEALQGIEQRVLAPSP